VAADMPAIDRLTFRRFKRFVNKFCRKKLQSLIFDPTEQFGFQEWIDNAPYTQARKKELTKAYIKV